MTEVIHRRHSADCAMMRGFDCTCTPEEAFVDEADDLRSEVAALRAQLEHSIDLISIIRDLRCIHRELCAGNHKEALAQLRAVLEQLEEEMKP